ncbi:MAG: TolC family protein [Polyangiales bacterium]
MLFVSLGRRTLIALAVPLQLTAMAATTVAVQSVASAEATADSSTAQRSEPTIPKSLTLDEALRIFHERGFDLLVAEANVTSVEGDVRIASAIANPQLSLAYGRVIGAYDPDLACTSGGFATSGCSKNSYTIGISDSAAVFDSLTGKRTLRQRVARKALAAAKLTKVDAQRNLDFQVKTSFINLAFTRAALKFAKEVQTASNRTYEINKSRYPGKINEGDFARIETSKLEADQQVELAIQASRAARVNLAFFLGVRKAVPDFDLDGEPLKYLVPGQLNGASEDELLKLAFTARPDLLALGFQKERAEASIALARRQRFPDITVSAQYNQIGTGQAAIQPPTVTFGVTFALPVFYRLQGEIRKANADLTIQTVTEQKVQAQILSDVAQAVDAYNTSKKLVDRMETGLLQSAKTARDITEKQFIEGKANLTDYLDAQRTFIATNLEYMQDLQSYWTAVYTLEQAVGSDLRK